MESSFQGFRQFGFVRKRGCNSGNRGKLSAV